jgi:two-component system OmpR family sensor kinase
MLNFQTRLILIHLAVIVVVLAGTGFGAYWMLSRVVHNQLDASLLALAETEAAILKTSKEQPIRIHEAPTSSTQQLSFVRIDRLVQIVDADGQVLTRSANLGSTRLPTPQALLVRLAAGETVFETLSKFGDEPVRMVSMPINGTDAPMTVQVAGSLDDVSKVLHSASLLFIVMTLGLLVAVGTVGTLLTRKVFKTIDNIVRQAHRIDEVNLSERLPHPGTRDEIGKLVDTLNEMLDRIERSFEVQRRFTADASHELRSPLSRLRTELEVTLRRPRDAAEYLETLRSCVEEVERLTIIVEELLALARLDAGLERNSAEIVPFNLIIEEVIARMQPIADKRGVRIILEPLAAVTVKIPRSSIDLVLTNLLDNAVKFTPSGGYVTVCLAGDQSEAILSVSDTGPGIKLDEQAKLFERFYRGFAARTNDVSGVGLGLALSQAVVRSHGGLIEASNLPGGGAQFLVRIPLILKHSV